MNIFTPKKYLIQTIDVLKVQIQEMFDDILSIKSTSSSKYRGNTYNTYELARVELDKKYNGTADWGVLQAGIIVDLRAVFTMANGIQVTSVDGTAKKEIDFTKKFLKFNKLDGYLAHEFAKESELDGKILIQLIAPKDPVKDPDEMIKARFLTYEGRKYTVKADDNDYMIYDSVEWEQEGDKKTDKVTIEQPYFVYRKFGGRIDDPNSAYSKVMRCLTQIESLDKALRDLRLINHLFASPVADVECASVAEVTSAQTALKDKNWKANKLFIHAGKFSYKQPDAAGVEMLISEILTDAKMISGTTGIPVHFLGLLDLLKNRATGDNTKELVNAATQKERETWKSAYRELIRKAMAIENELKYSQKSDGQKLNPDKIEISIPTITDEQWKRIKDVIMPAVMQGLLTKEYFLMQLPDLDVDAEMKRQAAEEKKELDETRHENDSLKKENDLLAEMAREKGNDGNTMDPKNKGIPTPPKN